MDGRQQQVALRKRAWAVAPRPNQESCPLACNVTDFLGASGMQVWPGLHSKRADEACLCHGRKKKPCIAMEHDVEGSARPWCSTGELYSRAYLHPIEGNQPRSRVREALAWLEHFLNRCMMLIDSKLFENDWLHATSTYSWVKATAHIDTSDRWEHYFFYKEFEVRFLSSATLWRGRARLRYFHGTSA